MGARGITAANLRSLDVLRGSLALYVVFTHARWLLWEGHAAFMAEPHPMWAKALAYGSGAFKYGHLAVMVFFALSGFFIHLRMAQKLAGGETSPRLDTKEYLARRAWRVLPPYYFALVLTIVLDVIGRSQYPALYNAATNDAFTNELFALKGFRLESVMPAMLLLPRSFGYYFGSNGPLWSLGFEIVYYLAYPAWFALRRRCGVRAYGFAFVFAAAMAALRGCVGIEFFEWFVEVGSLWAVWLGGAFLAEITSKRVFSPRLIPAALGAAMGAWLIQHAHLPKPLELPLLIVLGASVTFAFIALPSSCTSLPLWRWFEILGQRSYTLYVCHFPVLVLISARSFETGARPSHGWLALYGVVAALVACNLCFHLCEVYFIHPRIRIEPKPTPAPVPLAPQMALVSATAPSLARTDMRGHVPPTGGNQ